MVDQVFDNCVRQSQTSDDSQHGRHAVNTTKHASSSFLNTCTIQEFYELIQNHIQSHPMKNTGSSSSGMMDQVYGPSDAVTTKHPRVRRTVLLNKEMKSIIKERLQYLIQQQQQQSNPSYTNHASSLTVRAGIVAPATTTTTTTTTPVAIKEIEHTPVERTSVPKQPQPQPQQVETVRLTTTTGKERTIPAPQTISKSTDITIQNTSISNDDINGSSIHNPVTLDGTDIPPTLPPPKGRRARLPKPSKKKKLSMAEECMMIVENVKQKTNIRPPRQPVAKTIRGETPITSASEVITRKRKTTCPLCTKCPCQLKTHTSDDIDNPTASRNKKGKLDIHSFCQTDAATEKMLLQKLHKLEVTTDQYEEQTESIRRLVKKHRRLMYQKRQAMLQKYDRHNGNGKSSSNNHNNKTAKHHDGSRFLPNADEYQYHNGPSIIHNIMPHPPRPSEVEIIKTSMFGTVKPMTTRNNNNNNSNHNNFQPTLTQMIGSTTAIGTNGGNTINFSAADASPTVPNHTHDAAAAAEEEEDTNGDDTEATHDENRISDNTMVQSTPPKAHRVASSLILPNTCSSMCSSPPGTKYNCRDSVHHLNGSSIWDSFRYGIYDSSWDCWFSNSTETAVDESIAVNHLLQLLPTSPDVVATTLSSVPPTPPSHLSNRAEALVDDVMNKVCSNPLQLSALEHLNPNWKENIRYAIGQKDETTIHDALRNVRSVQDKLQSMKEQIIANIDRQQKVLDVYEVTLEKAQSRLGGSKLSPMIAVVGPCTDECVVADDRIPPTQGFFLSPCNSTADNHNNIHTDKNTDMEMMLSQQQLDHLFEAIDEDGAQCSDRRSGQIDNDMIQTIFYSHDDVDDETVDDGLKENDEHNS